MHGTVAHRHERATDSGAGSSGQRNTSASACDGVLKPRVCRGRPLSLSAMVSRSAWVRVRKSRVRGRYWRKSPLVFSLLPRCHGDLSCLATSLTDLFETSLTVGAASGRHAGGLVAACG